MKPSIFPNQASRPFPVPNATSISQSCQTSQEHTRQGFPAPRAQRPDDWMFKLSSAQAVDYQPGNAQTSNNNYFAKRENYQTMKNGMFNPLTGAEPLYGHVNYTTNPLQQEQTNAQASAYQLQKSTRVNDNMSPAYQMNFPAYYYPVNNRPNVWANVYQGSTNDKPPFTVR